MFYWSGGNCRDKQIAIDEHVREQFHNARTNYATVHDVDLRRWAMEKSAEVG